MTEPNYWAFVGAVLAKSKWSIVLLVVDIAAELKKNSWNMFVIIEWSLLCLNGKCLCNKFMINSGPYLKYFTDNLQIQY